MQEIQNIWPRQCDACIRPRLLPGLMLDFVHEQLVWWDVVNPQQVVGWHQAGRDDWLEGSSARHSRNSTKRSGKSCMWHRITL